MTTKTKKVNKVKSFQILKFDSEVEWLDARRGKVTGSKKIIGKTGGLLTDYWKLIVEGLGISEDTEDARERGKRLEPECMERFAKETGKKVDTSLVMWVSTENDKMAISPDGFIGDTEAVEGKALDAKGHLEVFFTQTIPTEYYFQKLQYFIINQTLQTLYFCFYNPNVPQKDFFIIEVHRKDIEDEIKFYHDKQVEILQDIQNKVLLLNNF